MEKNISSTNIALFAGIAVPVLMIILVIASIYIPAALAHPKFNFIYAVNSPGSYDCGISQYYINNNKVERRQYVSLANNIPGQTKPAIPPPPVPISAVCANYEPAQLFLYTISSGENTALTLTEAQQYNLDSSQQSPDGYTVTSGSNGSFLFGSINDYSSKYLIGHGASKRLNLNLSENNYYNFTFLGWTVNN